jgi:hypothetical protein
MKRLPAILGALVLVLSANFVSASRPTCSVFCVSSPCSKDSDCTDAPGGSCSLACPKVGCCVYP